MKQVIKQQNQQQQVVELRDRRIGKSMVVAMSCEITRKGGGEKETYKVQSESNVNKYYIVKFMDGCPVYCSCPDFQNRSKTCTTHLCKHMRSIVLAENYGLISKSWKEDEYSF